MYPLYKGKRGVLLESRSEFQIQRDSKGREATGMNCSFKNLEMIRKSKVE